MIITLLTDFGESDGYVAAMKGVILSEHPEATLVDISHEVPPHSVQDAAYLLLSCHADFPSSTIHVVVVDPGVGSSRRPVVAQMAGGQRLVGPDNGVLDWVLQTDAAEVRVIEAANLISDSPSTTFHGRDIFARTAAKLANGFDFEAVGDRIVDWIGLPSLEPMEQDGALSARVLHVDHFGNCILNVRRPSLDGREIVGISIGPSEIRAHHDHFEAAKPGEAFWYWGSAGFLEIAVNQASAADLLSVSGGTGATVSLGG